MPLTQESRIKLGWRKGKSITSYNLECKICGKLFKTVPSSLKQKTCSIECSRKRKIVERIKTCCKICNEEIFSRRNRKRVYCSQNCKIAGLAQDRIEKFKDKRILGKWKTSRAIKEYFLEKYKSCQICGYNNICGILEIHHIDRNSNYYYYVQTVIVKNILIKKMVNLKII